MVRALAGENNHRLLFSVRQNADCTGGGHSVLPAVDREESRDNIGDRRCLRTLDDRCRSVIDRDDRPGTTKLIWVMTWQPAVNTCVHARGPLPMVAAQKAHGRSAWT